MKKKLISGFCANGQHEATKPFSRRFQQPLPICTVWQTCTCACHVKITDMYASLGLEREDAQQNPAYAEWARREHAQFVLPDPVLDRMPVLSNADGGMVHPDDEEPYAAQQDSALGTLGHPAPGPVVPRFAPTPTGRRARGQLEYDVLTVCVDFANDVYEWDICTPKLVAEVIGKKYAVEPPSTGAIDAVWNRWETLAFAERDRKPSRFVRFIVENPSVVTLESIKARKKREKKRTVAEQRRGIPRPVKR